MSGLQRHAPSNTLYTIINMCSIAHHCPAHVKEAVEDELKSTVYRFVKRHAPANATDVRMDVTPCNGSARYDIKFGNRSNGKFIPVKSMAIDGEGHYID